mgnify:CR=1 FL=1
MEIERITVDANGKILGRLASEIALKLMGKHRVDFKPNMIAPVKITVVGIAGMRTTGKKITDKKYYHHSGYPGALTYKTLGERLSKEPHKVLLDAVSRMLPKNRLRARLIKNVTISLEHHGH